MQWAERVRAYVRMHGAGYTLHRAGEMLAARVLLRDEWRFRREKASKRELAAQRAHPFPNVRMPGGRVRSRTFAGRGRATRATVGARGCDPTDSHCPPSRSQVARTSAARRVIACGCQASMACWPSRPAALK